MLRDRVGQNAPVGPAGERDAVESASTADELPAGTVHGAQPGAAGEHERAVDVEEDELAHGRTLKHRVQPELRRGFAIYNPWQEASE